MKINMNKKLNWILITGGIGWGIPVGLFIYTLRWIECKPVALGSFWIAIVGGTFWGLFTYSANKNNPDAQLTVLKFFRSILFFALILSLYGIVFRYVLLPNDLQHSLWSSLILLMVICISILIEKNYLKRLGI